MRLDRNIGGDGLGKYALVSLRRLEGLPVGTPQELAAAILARPGAVEYGRPGEPDEFFAVKLRDAHARAALLAYASSVTHGGGSADYASDVLELAGRAGPRSPHAGRPG